MSDATRRPAVLKFGGTSVGKPDNLRRALRIVWEGRKHEPVVVVVSALSGVTDQLVEALAAAAQGQETAPAFLDRLFVRHRDLLTAVGGGGAESATLEAELERLRRLLRAVATLHEVTPRAQAAVMSAGERLSAPIFAAGLRALGQDARAVDAAGLIVTDASFAEATVDLPATAAAVTHLLVPVGDPLPVVTGFIGATRDGITTLLGRGGSDYSAAILGHALGADRVEIWTDVDGVMTADPRHVPEARTVSELSYAEASELARAGAKVLHPRTLAPLVSHGIPVLVRNTKAPAAPATRVVPLVAAGGAKAIAIAASVCPHQSRRRLALVGEGLGADRHLKSRVVLALERSGIPLRALVEEDGGRTLAVEVEDSHAASALRALHAGVIESEFDRPIPVWETAAPCPSSPRSRSPAASSSLCSSDGPSSE